MKTNVVKIAAVLLVAVTTLGGGNVATAAAINENDVPHMRALEEAKPPMENAPQVPPMEAETQGEADFEGYPEAMEDPQTPEQLARWGCYPGSWNWPQCRRGGPWGCYPGSWRWPRCRYQQRCHPGSWYWPRCRSW